MHVETTAELRDAVLAAAAAADAVVMAAAPGRLPPDRGQRGQDQEGRRRLRADPRPHPEPRHPPRDLHRTGPGPASVIVGFAAETGDDTGSVLDLARAKLARKGCDLLVVNDVSGGAVFGSPDNEAVILGRRRGRRSRCRGARRAALAHVIWDQVRRPVLTHRSGPSPGS